jgi:hypothetical protein
VLKMRPPSSTRPPPVRSARTRAHAHTRTHSRAQSRALSLSQSRLSPPLGARTQATHVVPRVPGTRAFLGRVRARARGVRDDLEGAGVGRTQESREERRSSDARGSGADGDDLRQPGFRRRRSPADKKTVEVECDRSRRCMGQTSAPSGFPGPEAPLGSCSVLGRDGGGGERRRWLRLAP